MLIQQQKMGLKLEVVAVVAVVLVKERHSQLSSVASFVDSYHTFTTVLPIEL